MKIISYLATLIVFTAIFLSSCNNVFAIEDNLGYSQITASSPFYFLKTIREGYELSQAKASNTQNLKQLEFATRRIREVKSLISTTHQDLIEPTLIKYSWHLNNIPQKDIFNELQIAKIKETLAMQLVSLQNIYTQVSNLRARMVIRSTINILIQRIDIPSSIKVPACNFLVHEASSSAINQTEKEVLKERATECTSNLTHL